MAEVSTIERLPDESARAYRARVEYVTMGPQRSLDTLAQKYNKSRSLFARWSVQHGWSDTARAWDDQQAAALQAHAATQYQEDLRDYRKRYGEMGKALYQAAGLLLRKVVSEAGKMEVSSNTLTLITNAAKTAADLEALSLRVESLLSDERSSEQSI